MPGTLAPSPWFTGLDDDGSPLAGGLLETYFAGTSTPADTYSDSDLLIPNTNPVELDAAGRATLYLAETSYKFVLRREDGSLVRSQDNIPATGLGTSGGFGETFVFGGDSTSPITATDYPAGTTVDKTHPGTGLLVIDSANLVGDYIIEAMMVSDGNTVRAALVNLSDGSPDTPLVEVTSTSTTGERVPSDVITFAAAGAERTYAIKTKINAGSGYVWQVKLTRVTQE